MVATLFIYFWLDSCTLTTPQCAPIMRACMCLQRKIRDLLTRDTAFYEKLPGENWLFFSVRVCCLAAAFGCCWLGIP